MVAPRVRASLRDSARVSCEGCTTFGTAAEAAIRKHTVSEPSAKPTTRIWVSVSRWTSCATATLPTAAPRSRSHQIIARLRFQRSTSAPAGNWKSNWGSSATNPATPADVGEPVRASTSRV